MRLFPAQNLVDVPLDGLQLPEPLLLADEPTGNLDQKNTREVVDLLKLSNRNLEQTILLITHDEKVAMEAGRIITLEDGRIVSDVRQKQ